MIGLLIQQSENNDVRDDIEPDDIRTLAKAVLRCRQDWGALEKAAGGAAAVSSSPPVPVNYNSRSRQKQHVRKLRDIEIQALECQGNTASPPDWSRVFVALKKKYSLISTHCVRQCYFVGPVLLLADGNENGETTVKLPDSPQFPHPSGIYNSTLSRSVVSLGSLVKNCSYICGAHISSGAALISCDTVCGTPEGTTFGNGISINLGPETGERAVVCHARTSIKDIISLVTGLASKEEKRVLSERAKVCSELVHCNFTIVEASAVLLSCKRVLDAYVGCGAIVRGADEILNCTLLSDVNRPLEIGSGTRLGSVIMKEGSCVTGGATVSCSLLMEHSSVGMHAKVTHAILCPDSGVSTGECHSSLVGPFVGFHHQSLLISAIWPLGRGNLAYGCNVGSNHTTRRADQEIWPGEGMFFGLGCTMKYPSIFLESPYTIIAADATCLPQRLRMPFSLLSSPSCINVPEDAPQTGTFLGLCNLRPGWVLSDDIYMIVRNEMKYKTRSKACHHNVGWPVFRYYNVSLMISARKRLREAKPSFILPNGSAIYIGDTAISGSGKNFVTEADRKKGIATYTLHIRRFALRSMLYYWEEVYLNDGRFPSCPLDVLPYGNAGENEPTTDMQSSLVDLLHTFRGGSGGESSAVTGGRDIERWYDYDELNLEWVKVLWDDDELQKDIAELSREHAAEVLFERLINIELKIYKSALKSRSNDYSRGEKVIPNYSNIHRPVEADDVLHAIYEEYAVVKDRVDTLWTSLFSPIALDRHNVKQLLILPVANELKRM